ncbi:MULTISPECIES: SDR family oxidoreductase [Acidiphilium]|uniref:Gluconate 5-dehydrogenase n=1 Tax=Acidiphilium rubrum TaxID=526 RepID=A0A8G2CHS9_ACIRU|nr:MULTISPECIES: SDR family oxidoreductase [Acidiphilium]SIQ10059.1 gluconate 5-dehydrogenase [Acidiphilium rubrum]
MTALKSLFDLTGKRALITGGSRGLGLQIAEALGEYGATIAISARKADELDEAVRHLASKGIAATAHIVDLGKPEGPKALADAVLALHSEVDILVNNAGATWGAPAADVTPEAWARVMNLNVNNLFFLTQEIARRSMIPRRAGKILNIASIAGLRGHHPDITGTIPYNTSKGAVVNLTRALAAEWGPHNITVNAIAPGFFPSKMTKGILGQFETQVLHHTPLGKLGNNDDMKGAALLFCSAASGHITGQILAIDGGTMVV